jgi:mobilization protein NikA
MANYSAKGRPRKKAADKLGQIIQFRMTKEERALCEGAAKEAKVRLSAWIRDTLLGAAGKKG